jgi:hypothetical protein
MSEQFTKLNSERTMDEDKQREIDGENQQREYEAHLGMLAMLEDMDIRR